MMDILLNQAEYEALMKAIGNFNVPDDTLLVKTEGGYHLTIPSPSKSLRSAIEAAL